MLRQVLRHKVACPLQRVVAIASLSVLCSHGSSFWYTWSQLLRAQGSAKFEGIQVYPRTREVAVKMRVATKSRQVSEQTALSTSGPKKHKCYGAARSELAKRERARHNKVLSSIS